MCPAAAFRGAPKPCAGARSVPCGSEQKKESHHVFGRLSRFRPVPRWVAHAACEALARRFCTLPGENFDPKAVHDSWRDTAGMGMGGGIQSFYTLSGGTRLLREVSISVMHEETTPETESIRTADAETRAKRSPGLIAAWEARRAAANHPALVYWDTRYSGMSAPKDGVPRPPPLERVQGPVFITPAATGLSARPWDPTSASTPRRRSPPFTRSA